MSIKKKVVALLMTVMATTAIGGMVSCGDADTDGGTSVVQTVCTVRFDSNGGTAVPEQGVYKNGKIVEPGTPSKFGYDFVGWRTEEGKTWNFDVDTVSGDMVLTAQWQIKGATDNSYFTYADVDGGACEISIKVGQTLPKDVVIPSVNNGKDVVAIADNAFEGQTEMCSVVIPDTVKTIGLRAFRNCENLETILGADNVEEIRGAALSGTKYRDNLPSGVAYLGKCLYAYAGEMRANTEITVEAGTLGIAACAFQDMTNLTAITLPAGLKRIGNYAFGGTEAGAGITELVIPDSVVAIGDNAFRNAALTAVTIGSGVQSIGANAFAGTAIASLKYNANATVRNNSFAGITAAATIEFGDDVAEIPVDVVKGFDGLTAVIIGSGISVIPDNAFDGLTDFAGITVKGTLTEIGNYAFRGTGITEFTIGGQVTKIGASAFADCKALVKVVYNAVNATGTTELGMPFAGCTALKTVEIGENVTAIPAFLFENCAALDTLKLGANITSIGEKAFYGIAIPSVTISEKVESIGNNAFGGNAALVTAAYNATAAVYAGPDALFAKASSITVGAGVTKIPAYFAKDNVAITSITLPSTVKEVGTNAFLDCSALETVEGVEGINVLGQDVFKGTPWLETYAQSAEDNLVYIGTILYSYNGTMPANYTLTIEEGTTAIAAGAFAGKTNLVAISALPATLVDIGDKAFDGCNKLVADLDLSNVKTIGERAFYNCSKLTSITFGEGIESIGANAFYGCSAAVMDLVIPETFKFLGERAFYTCRKLASVEVKGGLTSIPDYAFYSATGLKTVKLAACVERLGDNWASLSSVTEFVAPGVKYVGSNGLSNLNVDYSVENVIEFGASALSYFGASEVVIGENCTAIGASLLANTYGLTKVTIKSTKITAIPGDAFSGCSALETVILPASITEFGSNAFKGCSALRDLDISNITSFGDYCFQTAFVAGTTLTLNENLTKIGAYAFNTPNLTGEITISGTLPEIGTWSFNGAGITKLTVRGVKEIQGAAFRDCKQLAEIILEDGMETLQGGCFMGIANYAKLTLPKTIKVIAANVSDKTLIVYLNEYFEPTDMVLSNATSGSSIRSTSILVCKDAATKAKFVADNSVWKEKCATWDTWKNRFVTPDNYYGANKDWIINDDGIYVYYSGDKTDFVIPKELKVFPGINTITGVSAGTTDAAFATAKETLQALRIAVEAGSTTFKMKDNMLMSMDETIIYACNYNSTEASFSSDKVVEVGAYAFAFMENLTSIDLPNLKTVGTYAFFKAGITSATLNKLETIGDYGFGRSALTTITMNNVKTIGGNAFEYTQLTSVSLENVETIGTSAFRYITTLHTVTIGDKCTSIGNYAFGNGDTTLELTIKATAVPKGGTNFMGTKAAFQGKIYVPAAQLDDYKAASIWVNYADKIEAIVE